MSKAWIGSLMSLVALGFGATYAQAQTKHHSRKRVIHRAPKAAHVAKSGAENGLVGIHLFDSAEHVIGVYGSPDDVQPLTLNGGQQTGGFGGGGGGFGAPGGAGGPGGPGGPGGMGRLGGGRKMDDMTPDDLRSQFEFGDSMLQAGRFPGQAPGGGGFPGAPPGMSRPGGGGNVPGGPGSGVPGGFGPPGMGRPGGGGRGIGGPGGAGGGVPNSGGATESVTYTRWIYNRSNNKFAFIVNRLGQVIQIEAIGLSNPKVKTSRGIGFGNQFGSIIQAYHNPDGYDIGGDNIMVKYLVKDKVAFRLTRLGDKKPHQVTGIVVSAGKG